MHPISPALPAVDDAAARQIVLRDGSVARVRRSTHADVQALRKFFRDLSAESHYRRFFTAADPTNAVIARLSDATNPAQGLTLIAQRSVDGELRIVATASYIALGADEAEVAFAVADQFPGKGLGTALLERLAVTAASEGFRRFRAIAEPRQRPDRSWIESRYRTRASIRALAASSLRPSRLVNASPQTGISKVPCGLTSRPSMMRRVFSIGNLPPFFLANWDKSAGLTRSPSATGPSPWPLLP